MISKLKELLKNFLKRN